MLGAVKKAITSVVCALLLAAPAPAIASEGIFNDASCTPAAGKTTPVLYVHGTSANTKMWRDNAVALKAAGHCVWGFDFGRGRGQLQAMIPSLHGTGDIDASAAALADNIEKVKEATGASQVDLVAHSQGGLLVKKYIAELGGGENVRRVVSVGATFHGTDLGGSAKLLSPLVKAFPRLAAFFVGPAALQQLKDSELIQQLNTLPDTEAGIVYTSLYSPSDTTATPNSTSVLEAVDGADVANVNIEQACPNAGRVLHADMQSDHTVAALTKWGLSRAEGEHVPGTKGCNLS